MILSFVLALAAGYAAPHAEPHVRRLIASALKTDVRLDPADLRVLTLLLLLALAVLVTLATGARSSGLALVLGAGLGVFGLRLYAFLRDPDGTDVPEEARWDGRVRPPGENQGPSGPHQDESHRADRGGDADAAALRAVDAAMKEPEPAADPPEPTRKERSP
ncbi:MAG: hypothetical protein AAGG09_11515 [Pseudomonadota bacterium]